MTVILNAAYGRFATVAVLIAGSEAEHSSRVARKIGRPLLQLANQPTCATRSWASPSAAVAGCAGSWSTVAS